MRFMVNNLVLKSRVEILDSLYLLHPLGVGGCDLFACGGSLEVVNVRAVKQSGR